MPLFAIALPIALAILKVALVALTGYGLARRQVLHRTALVDLSALVVGVTAPCLLFANTARGFAGLNWPAAALAVLSAPALLGLGYVCGLFWVRVLRVAPAHRRAVLAASTFQNSAYLPLAVSTAVLPPLAVLFPAAAGTRPEAIAGSGIVDVSLFGLLYSPLFWGLGLWWLQQEEQDRPGPARFPWQRLVTPPVAGVLLGLVFALTPLHGLLTARYPLGSVVLGAVVDIGSLTIPLANLILGGMLGSVGAGRPWRLRDAAGTTLAGLICVPLLSLGILWLTERWWRHDGRLAVAAFVVLLEAISPPATNLAVASSRGQESPTMAVIPGLLLAAYLLAMLTMPFWLLLFFRLLHAV